MKKKLYINSTLGLLKLSIAPRRIQPGELILDLSFWDIAVTDEFELCLQDLPFFFFLIIEDVSKTLVFFMICVL